jgi:hypothetical protein
VDPVVDELDAVHPVLLLKVRVKSSLNVVDDRLPPERGDREKKQQDTGQRKHVGQGSGPMAVERYLID